jgi:AraC-like DNA-binding protein
MFFMAPGWSHSWRVRRAPVVISSFQLRLHPEGRVGKKFVAELHALSEQHRFRFRPSRDMAQWSRAWRDALEGPASPLLGTKLQAWFQLYLCGFFEQAIGRQLPPAPAANPSPQWSSRRPSGAQLASFIDQNIHRPIQLEDISSHFQYSQRHVGRIFFQAHGVAIGTYISQRKLHVAKQLLANSPSPVKEIAHSLGFADAGYFSRFFRQQTGLSPQAFRK